MYFFIIAAICIVIATITAGFVLRYKKGVGKVSTKKALGWNLLSFVPIIDRKSVV